MQNDENPALQRRIDELEKDAVEFRSIRNALMEEQRFLTELTNRLPGMAYTRHDNPNWTMDYVSRGCLALTGYSVNDLTGNNKISFARLIADTDLPQARQEIQTALQAKTDYRVHFRIHDRAGAEKWVWEQGQGVYSTNGELINLVGFISDVTEDKKADEKLQQSTESLRKAFLGTVQAVSTAMEFRDPYTAGHERRVSDLAVVIATKLGLSPWQIEGVRVAGLIHDIGKIYVPIEILSKPGRLNDVEMSLIRMHSQAGFEILKGPEFPWPVAEIVVQHHERIDGTGYPRGLQGEDMLMEAKIISVADVVEAMASPRPYRPALGIDMALEEIINKRGKQFDSPVADICIDVFRKNSFQFTDSGETARKRLL